MDAVGFFAGGVVVGGATKQAARFAIPIVAGAVILGYVGHSLGMVSVRRRRVEEVQKKVYEVRDEILRDMDTDRDGRVDTNDVRNWLDRQGLLVPSGAAITGFVCGFLLF